MEGSEAKHEYRECPCPTGCGVDVCHVPLCTGSREDHRYWWFGGELDKDLIRAICHASKEPRHAAE